MNGDFSRLTYRQDKHYSSVRLQQGRVLLDAEWNEQVDIQTQHERATVRDLIGPCGAPSSPPGKNFQILVDGKDFKVADGHIYVDGILAVAAEKPVAYTDQPDFPNPPELKAGQAYLVYLDVWERHLTALEQSLDEQPQIREVALGGPDTATRTRIIWQAKVQALVDATATCANFGSDWLPDGTKSTGQLRAQAAVPTQNAPNDCLVPDGGGYRRLENQLYRVEIHEVDNLGKATYKWSRDNGSVLTKLVKVDTTVPTTPVITVSDPGKDDVLGFAAAAWVEISHEEHTLHNRSGVLLEVASVKGDRITLKNPDSLGLSTGTRPTVRRWEGFGTVEIGTLLAPKWLDLEDGVQVEFSTGNYVSGDYWTIPARTLTGKVEWPQDASGPLFESRHGIKHYYCTLALLQPDGATWKAGDCRPSFPALTELTTLLYEGGDGQEALPNSFLPLPLSVRVVNGQAPVIGARVGFTIILGGGLLSEAVVSTGPNGIAQCRLMLSTDAGPQQVQATLLDASGNSVPGQILDFNANISVASQVAYDPTVQKCKTLKDVKTVQEAIDKLCAAASNGPQEEVFHVIKVITGKVGEPNELPIQNDSDLPVARLANVIQIECDQEVEPRSVNNRDKFQNAVCFITLNLPFPSQVQRKDWLFNLPVGFQTITLLAEVEVSGKVIQWKPEAETSKWLISAMFPAIKSITNSDENKVLARLTLKGNFIWEKGTNPEIYLDGDTFGVDAKDHTEIKLRSGDGRRGGDFEMWFWLTEK